MYHALSRIIRKLRRRRRLGALFLVAVLLFSLAGNTVIFYIFDRMAHDPPLTLWDSVWYSIISVTTIGYGDFSAETVAARLGTLVFIIFIGLAAFTTSVGIIVEWVVDLRQKERNGMGRATSKGHLIIVNFPNESRIRQIVDEFCIDHRHKGRDVVIITNEIEQLPFDLNNVSFIRGSPLEQDSYERADIAHASQAIILSTSYDDPRSDSFVASAAFVAHRNNPDIGIVAEVLDPKHDVLFDLASEVSLVYTLKMANNMLVQEAQDPGVHALSQAITSNEMEGTLASTVAVSPPPGMSYVDAAKALLDEDVNLVGVVRDGSVIASLVGQSMTGGDRLVYISKLQIGWSEIGPMLAAAPRADAR